MCSCNNRNSPLRSVKLWRPTGINLQLSQICCRLRKFTLTTDYLESSHNIIDLKQKFRNRFTNGGVAARRGREMTRVGILFVSDYKQNNSSWWRPTRTDCSLIFASLRQSVWGSDCNCLERGCLPSGNLCNYHSCCISSCLLLFAECSYSLCSHWATTILYVCVCVNTHFMWAPCLYGGVCSLSLSSCLFCCERFLWRPVWAEAGRYCTTQHALTVNGLFFIPLCACARVSWNVFFLKWWFTRMLFEIIRSVTMQNWPEALLIIHTSTPPLSAETTCYCTVCLDKRGVHAKYVFDVGELSETLYLVRAVCELKPASCTRTSSSRKASSCSQRRRGGKHMCLLSLPCDTGWHTTTWALSQGDLCSWHTTWVLY